MKPLLYANTFNVKPRPGSFRDYYRAVYGPGPFPVDRFNLLPHIDPETDPIPVVNIVPKPEFNLSNLTSDWRDRYFSLFDQVASTIYETAGTRDIVLMYSGGIDSTAVLVALMKNARYKEFLDQGRIKIAMSSVSIHEYPELFYETILPTFPIMLADYNLVMQDPNAFVVTGDAGDYVIGNTDTPIFFHNGTTDNLHEDKSILWPYLDNIDTSKKFSNFASKLAELAPFDIVSLNQMYWWIGQAFVHQGEMCYPWTWSATTDLSELASFNKVYRFFLDPRFTTFSFEYMSTNPVCTNYNSVRQFPREYIVDFTQHPSYLNKIKVFSQKLLFRKRYKTRIYADLTFASDLTKL